MNEQKLKALISQGKITIESDEIILDDEFITKKEFVSSMKKIYNDSKEDFSEYKKSTQKSRQKRRKCK